MQDQVTTLMTLGTYATYLGLDQFNKQVESASLQPKNKYRLFL